MCSLGETPEPRVAIRVPTDTAIEEAILSCLEQPETPLGLQRTLARQGVELNSSVLLRYWSALVERGLVKKWTRRAGRGGYRRITWLQRAKRPA